LAHITLVDWDNNQIYARMATHLADAGRALEEGDIIQLELFSEITYHVNGNSPPMSALFIIGYTRVGHAPLEDLHEMIHYAPSPLTHQSQSTP